MKRADIVSHRAKSGASHFLALIFLLVIPATPTLAQTHDQPGVGPLGAFCADSRCLETAHTLARIQGCCVAEPDATTLARIHEAPTLGKGRTYMVDAVDYYRTKRTKRTIYGEYYLTRSHRQHARTTSCDRRPGACNRRVKLLAQLHLAQ